MFPRTFKNVLFTPKLTDLESVNFERVYMIFSSLRLWKLYFKYEMNAYQNGLRKLFFNHNEHFTSKFEGALSQAMQEEI